MEPDLRRLGTLDLDDLAAERVRRRAQAALAEEKRLMSRPVARAVARVVTPLLLAGACAGYFAWIVAAVGAIYR